MMKYLCDIKIISRRNAYVNNLTEIFSKGCRKNNSTLEPQSSGVLL